MYRTLDIRSALSLGLRIPQGASRLVPQSSSGSILLVLFLLFLICVLVAVLKSPLFSNSPEVDAGDPQDVPDQCATKELSETRGSKADSGETPLAAPPRTNLLSSIGNMMASTLVARPVPIPEPSTLIDRAPDVAPKLEKPEAPWPVKQPYDAFLVLDVEATCQEGTDFNWPNEIIEWPVCLLRWRHKDMEGRAKELYVADEFRSFVKPTWKPELSAFCTSLTGITQADVDRAPKFAKVLESFKEFLVRNDLIDAVTGEKRQRFAWCSDGPFDIRDFVVKQCFISKIQMPEWLKGDVLDVRKVVTYYLALQEADVAGTGTRQPRIVFPKASSASNFSMGRAWCPPGMPAPKRRSLNIPQQLRALSLPAFVGRQHSGIDDTRNISRIVTELAKRGIRLEPNTTIYPGRRWQWMGKPGQILEEYCFI